MFPDDATLLARGKYSTLSHERHEQLKRVQAICSTIVTEAQAVLRDCEAKPPNDGTHLNAIKRCIDNLYTARERLITVSLGMNELQSDAWPQ